MAQGKTSSPQRKANRAASRVRGEERKKKRREENERQRQWNITLRKAGEPTATDIAKAKRAEKRGVLKNAYAEWQTQARAEIRSIEADESLSKAEREAEIAKINVGWKFSKQYKNAVKKMASQAS